MQTNNQYYKTICENMNIPIEAGVHDNNYYLKKIATVGYGKSYTGTVCNGILIKDIAEIITGNTYTGNHFTNFYLKEIASALSPGGDYNNKYDNYLLNIWAESIDLTKPSNLIWQVTPSYMEGDFNATGLLTGENNTPIAGATVFLMVDSTKVYNAQTNNNGVVTFTGISVYVGTHTFKLVFDGNPSYRGSESSEVTINTSLDLAIETHGTYDNNLKNITISGNVLIDNQAVEKPIQIYRYNNNNNWEYLNTVTSNSQGEFSLIDKGAVYLNDDSVAGTRNELQTLIDNAITNNESEVVLNKKYVFSENDTPIVITDSIQIKGNNHIIDANNYSQIFSITGNDVTISDLILINGYANGNGGAVNWSGENGILSNILFVNCMSTQNGGAVYWTGDTGTVQNCRAVNNRTGSNGTIYAEVDNFTITNHESFGNHSESEGGCIDIRGNYAHIESINTSKDRSGGGKACINVIGYNSNIHHIDINSPVYGGSYINRSYISEDSFKYKVQPAPSWIENYEDFALEKEYTPIHDILISSDKDILSFKDNDVATLTAQLVDSNNESIPFNGLSVTFEVRKQSDDSLVETLTGVTDAGLATVRYDSKGIGNLNIKAECMFVSKRYDVQDCYRYDDASSDKTSSYGSPLVYRGSGSGTWNYNSTNGYYGTITESNECMVELSELTGKDDFTIEFDALLNVNYGVYYGIAGICAYENNDNYSRLSCHNKAIAQRVSVNGSANEIESNVLTTVSRYDILHYKFTISNNQIIEEVTRGTTLIGTRTISYTPTSNTKYGIGLIWSNDWVKDTFIKNIKIKPL